MGSVPLRVRLGRGLVGGDVSVGALFQLAEGDGVRLRCAAGLFALDRRVRESMTGSVVVGGLFGWILDGSTRAWVCELRWVTGSVCGPRVRTDG